MKNAFENKMVNNVMVVDCLPNQVTTIEFLTFVKNVNKENKKLVLYGAGYYGKLLYDVLKNMDIEVSAFAVSNGEAKEKTSRCAVYYISELPYEPKDCVFIITLKSFYHFSIIENLQQQYENIYALDEEEWEKIHNIRIKQNENAFHHMMEIVERRPLDINIELINSCPLACKFCCNRKIKRDHKMMDMKLFEKICGEYLEIGGGGLGLSSMQSDVFMDPLLIERLKFLQKIKKNLFVYTTNPLISLSKYTNEELRVILETFDLIQVSVLGVNEKDYQEMGGINGFHSFINNLYRIKAIKDQYHLDVRIDLYFRTYDIDKLKKDALYKKLTGDFFSFQIINSYFDWFGTIKAGDLPFGAKLISKTNTEENIDCVACVSTMSIDVYGKVVGCGCIDWNSKYVIGDCSITELKDIWNSRLAIEFRQAFSHNNIPDICKQCGLYTSTKMAYARKELEKYKVTDGIYYTL